MSDARPHLVALEGQAEAPPEGAAAPLPAGPLTPQNAPNRAAWLAGGLALACAIGWGVQSREGRALEQELARTTEALVASQSRVGALEAQKLEIQTQAEALITQAGGLVGQMNALLGDLGALGSDLGSLGEFAGSDPQAEDGATTP